MKNKLIISTATRTLLSHNYFGPPDRANNNIATVKFRYTSTPDPESTCFCGKNKKYKKCCGRDNPKPRNREAIITVFNYSSLFTYEAEFKRENIKLFVNGLPLNEISYVVETSYEKTGNPNKPNKWLSRFASEGHTIHIDPNSLLKDFDAIYAVDTNTTRKKINGDHISVTAIARVIIDGDSGASTHLISAIEFRNVSEAKSPEKLGWSFLIGSILKSKDWSKGQKVAIIVDSDLGNIESYNNREKPYFNDKHLPINFKLFYATSDIANNSSMNYAIRFCDKNAKAMLQHIKENIHNSDNLIVSTDNDFTHFRSLIKPSRVAG